MFKEILNQFFFNRFDKKKLNEGNVNPKKIAQLTKEAYKKLSDRMENEEKMEEYYLKLDYEKQLLVIKKFERFHYFIFFIIT